MQRLEESGLVLRNRLTFTEVRDGGRPQQVQVRGRIECANDVVVFVDKWLEVRRGRQGRNEVRAFSYSYHAWIWSSRRQLLRYDSAHGLHALHRHRFDPHTGEEQVTAVSLKDLPTLDGVIREAVDLAVPADSTADP